MNTPTNDLLPMDAVMAAQRAVYGGRAGIRVKMILKRKSSKSSSCYAPDEFIRAFPVTGYFCPTLVKVKPAAHPLAGEVTGQVSQAAILNASI